FAAVLRATGLRFVNVNRLQQRFFGQQPGFFSGAADTNAEHARPTPASAHVPYLFQHPIHHRVRRVQHGELGFGFRTATFGCDVHVDGVTRNQFHVDDGRGVVFGVGTLAVRIGQHRRTQHVVRVGVSTAYAFVTHIFHAHVAFELHVHTD